MLVYGSGNSKAEKDRKIFFFGKENDFIESFPPNESTTILDNFIVCLLNTVIPGIYQGLNENI